MLKYLSNAGEGGGLESVGRMVKAPDFRLFYLAKSTLGRGAGVPAWGEGLSVSDRKGVEYVQNGRQQPTVYSSVD